MLPSPKCFILFPRPPDSIFTSAPCKIKPHYSDAKISTKLIINGPKELPTSATAQSMTSQPSNYYFYAERPYHLPPIDMISIPSSAHVKEKASDLVLEEYKWK